MVLRDIETGELIVPFPFYAVLKKDGREVYLNYTTWQDRVIRDLEAPDPKDDSLECTSFTVDLKGNYGEANERSLPKRLFPNTSKFFDGDFEPTIN